MREKMLGVSRRLREMANEGDVDLATPEELLHCIAEAIEEELKAHQCPYCPKTFAMRAEIDSHVRVIHGIDNPS